MGFIPGVSIISDERYEEINGKDGELTNPQNFFRKQVELKHLTISKSKSKTIDSDDPVEIVSGMNVKDAVKFCTDCGDARVLKKITDSEKREKVLSAAKSRYKELTTADEKED
tara:strand:+ start:4211 stop:4549 length:339 start_codon:yes stop_codon:yes gene_type:complete